MLKCLLLYVLTIIFPLTANNISKESMNCTFQWVTKWVDYSNKYGFGYQLSDHTVGVLFNNGTHMSLLSDKKYVKDNFISLVTSVSGALSMSLNMST